MPRCRSHRPSYHYTVYSHKTTHKKKKRGSGRSGKKRRKVVVHSLAESRSGGTHLVNLLLESTGIDRQESVGINRQESEGSEVVKPCPAPGQASRPSVGSDSRPVPSRHAVSCDIVFQKTLTNIKAPPWLH